MISLAGDMDMGNAFLFTLSKFIGISRNSSTLDRHLSEQPELPGEVYPVFGQIGETVLP